MRYFAKCFVCGAVEDDCGHREADLVVWWREQSNDCAAGRESGKKGHMGRDKEKKKAYDKLYRERIKAETERVNAIEAAAKAKPGPWKPTPVRPPVQLPEGVPDRQGSTGSTYQAKTFGQDGYSALRGW